MTCKGIMAVFALVGMLWSGFQLCRWLGWDLASGLTVPALLWAVLVAQVATED